MDKKTEEELRHQLIKDVDKWLEFYTEDKDNSKKDENNE